MRTPARSERRGAVGQYRGIPVQKLLQDALIRRSVCRDDDVIFVTLASQIFQSQISHGEIFAAVSLDKEPETLVGDFFGDRVQRALRERDWVLRVFQIQIEHLGVDPIADLQTVCPACHQFMHDHARLQRAIHQIGTEKALAQLALVI